MRVGIIGGTGLDTLAGDVVEVDTPHGPVDVTTGELDAHRFFFVPRHGRGHKTPPHRIEHRANVAALAACHVDHVFAVNAVGALDPALAVPAFVVPDDVWDLTRGPGTFFDDVAVHIDLSRPYCPTTRVALLEAARATGVPVHDGGVYAAVTGPRLETPAEVRFLRERARVVGMTGMPEAALAREASLCYASLCVATNTAAGPGNAHVHGHEADVDENTPSEGGGVLTARDIRAVFHTVRPAVEATVRRAAHLLPPDGSCRCRTALPDAYLTEEDIS